jgi:outer membrane protein assembly factor BamE (lipoprotein component of BamABCDE complex)
MQTLNLRSLVLPTALLACTALSGCLIGSESHTNISGRYISEQTLAQVTPGKSRDYVLALLGEPAEKTSIPDGTEIWKWRYSERKQNDTSVIFLVGAKSETQTDHTSYVEMKDDAVVKAWRD